MTTKVENRQKRRQMVSTINQKSSTRLENRAKIKDVLFTTLGASRCVASRFFRLILKVKVRDAISLTFSTYFQKLKS